MPKAPVTDLESERIRALRQCCVLDTAPEADFDDLTRFAARVCNTPIALVSLVDTERQWFKSCFGLPVRETHRDFAFCAHAILGHEPLLITDASSDPRTSDNPLVSGAPHIRFYAGIPLRSSDGYALGTLCVIDTVPRVLSPEQLLDLESLARQASGQIELRRANHLLAGERERLELALTGAQLGTWDWNVQTGAELLDARWAEIVGERLEDLGHRVEDWSSRMHPDDAPRTWQCVQDHFSGLAPIYDAKFRLRHVDGSWRWVVARGRLVERDRRGRPLRMVGTMADITEQVHAENEVKSFSELLRQFISCTPAAVAMLDMELRYLHVSERWSQDYNLHHTDLIGKSHYDLIPDIPERWRLIYQSVLAGATEVCLEDRFDRRDGTTAWLQWEARPWRNSANEIGGLILFTQVITERIKAEAELVAAREAAETANRSKSGFLANMSHEIRTPLTSILGYADLLNDTSLSEEDRQFSLATIKHSGKHLLTVINDILDLSKIEAGKMTMEQIWFPPAAIVEEVLSYFQVQAALKDLSLVATVEGLIPTVICSDPVRLRQMLVNLVGNAIKFTESGGIKIVVRMAPEERIQQPRLAFEVHDSGIGIASTQLEVLFAPFVQVDASTTRKAGGTGLGLTICRRMARLLGGDVSVDSLPGLGSVFTVTIGTGPLDGVQLTSSLSISKEPKPTPQPTTQLSGRILLAEDSPLNQRLIRTLLMKAGAIVDVVENGRDAVEKALLGHCTASTDSDSQSGAGYDLVLMDVQMPVLDGYGAASELRRRGFDRPIVALTANAMIEDRQRCLSAGCDDYMTKPIDRARLLGICHDWLSGSCARTL